MPSLPSRDTKSGIENRSTRTFASKRDPSGINPTIHSILETVRNYKRKNGGLYHLRAKRKKSAKLRSSSATAPSLQTERDYDMKIEANSVDGFIIQEGKVIVKSDNYIQKAGSE